MFNTLEPDYDRGPDAPGRPPGFYRARTGDEAPVLTLITLVRDRGAPARALIRQVLGQSFQSWEWLVLSKHWWGADKQTAGAWREADQRIRPLDCPPDFTDAEFYNRAIKEAQGDTLVFLDEADLLEPTSLEKWFWALHTRPWCPWVTGSTVHCGEHGRAEPLNKPSGAAFPTPGSSDRTFMIRRDVFNEQGHFREAFSNGDERREFWHRCANAGLWGLRLPEHHKWTRLAPWEADAFREREDGELYRWRCRAHNANIDTAPFPYKLVYNTELSSLPQQIPCANRLEKARPRLLVLLQFLFAGGAEKVALDAVAQLTGRGWDVTVAATGDADHNWLSEFARHTPDVFVLQHFLNTEGKPGDYPRFLRYLANSRQFDVVLLSNTKLGYGLLPALRSWLPEAAFVDIRHNANWPQMSQEAEPLLDRRIVSFTKLRDQITTLFPTTPPAEVLYTNVDTDLWRPASPDKRREVRRSLGVADDIPIILYTARLVDTKQPEVFARTVLALHRRGLRFVAVAVGDGPLLPWLRTFAVENGLENRMFILGNTGAERLRELTASADIAFLPTRAEGIAMVAFEAMACALPVVSADVGGMAELIIPTCGILIENAEPAIETRRYTDILADLLTRPDVRHQMGRAALHRIQRRFRLDQMGEQLDGLLRGVVEQARHASRQVAEPMVGAATTAAILGAESDRFLALVEQHARALEGMLKAEQGRNASRGSVAAFARRAALPTTPLGRPRQVALDATAVVGQPLTGIQRVTFELAPRISQHCWDSGASVLLGHSLGRRFTPIFRWDNPVPAETVQAALLSMQTMATSFPKALRWIGGAALQMLKWSGMKALLRRTSLGGLDRPFLKQVYAEVSAGRATPFQPDDAFIGFSVGTNPIRIPHQIDPRHVQLILHDLIPIQWPGYVSPRATTAFGENLLPLVFGSHQQAGAYRLVTPSKSVAKDVEDFYTSLGCPVPPVDAVYWGYSREKFYPDPDPGFRRKLGIPDNALLVLAVSTIDPRKRFDQIAEAVRTLNDRHPTYGVFIGHGARDAASDRVRYLGHVDDDTLRRAYSTCDVCVNWSICEGFGLPVIEALACGATVVVPPDNPTLREIGGAAVRIAPTATVEGLADAIMSAKAMKNRRGVVTLDQFNWEQAAWTLASNAGVFKSATPVATEPRRAA